MQCRFYENLPKKIREIIFVEERCFRGFIECSKHIKIEKRLED